MTENADFAPLGDMEFENAGEIFQQCEFVRRTASNAGLILLQWSMDVDYALASVPVLDPGGWHGIGADNPRKRAARVSRHLFRSAESLKAAAEGAAKFPEAYRKAFSDVIQSRRDRKVFDPKAGL